MVRRASNWDNRRRTRDRISHILTTWAHNAKEDIDSDPQVHSHNAKYICVLISGYLEQAIKEILLLYVHDKVDSKAFRYFQQSWPRSMGMKPENILSLLDKFDTEWKTDLKNWFQERETREDDIKNLISWRNQISHGAEANTDGVTYPSIKVKFKTVCDLIDKLETMIA